MGNKYQDGEKVKLKETGEEVTVDRWNYAPNMRRYTYTIVEQPSTFYFEEEIQPTERG